MHAELWLTLFLREKFPIFVLTPLQYTHFTNKYHMHFKGTCWPLIKNNLIEIFLVIFLSWSWKWDFSLLFFAFKLGKLIGPLITKSMKIMIQCEGLKVKPINCEVPKENRTYLGCWMNVCPQESSGSASSEPNTPQPNISVTGTYSESF